VHIVLCVDDNDEHKEHLLYYARVSNKTPGGVWVYVSTMMLLVHILLLCHMCYMYDMYDMCDMCDMCDRRVICMRYVCEILVICMICV